MPRRRQPRTDYLRRVRPQENAEGRRLRKISAHVGELIKTWAAEHEEAVLDPANLPQIREQLENVEKAIGPWAETTARRAANEVAIRERRAWMEHELGMHEGLMRTLRVAPEGAAYNALIREQADAIKSIPRRAALRLYGLVGQGLENSERASEYIEEIHRSGEVSKAHATMLARTMVSSTASVLIEARARAAGSTSYVWETARDAAVRPSHRTMQGVEVDWDDPPTLDNYTAHAGRYANCRCYPRPIFPDLG